MSQFVRQQPRAGEEKQRFFKHVGAIKGGAPDLSSRKGYSRS
jgi:hypothetical protein